MIMSKPNSKPKHEKERRESYLQSTLRQIREKRLSHDAAHKGLFPNRTPSRLLSPTEVISEKHAEKKKSVFKPDRPALSLTKLDFELLREWDWKERQKRLETWGRELGITKQHRNFSKRASKIHGEQDDDDLYSRKQKNLSDKERMEKKSKPGTSKVILKRELEHLTGLNVYAPGDNKRTNRSRRRHSDSGFTTSSFRPSVDIMDVVSSHHRHRHHHHHHSHHSETPSTTSTKTKETSNVPSQGKSQSGHLNTLKSRRMHLDKMKMEASAASSKKTFGKGGWSAGGGGSSKPRAFTPSAPNISVSPRINGEEGKTHSQELAESQMALTSGGSRGSSAASRQRHHHHHYPHSRHESEEISTRSTAHHHPPHSHFSHSRTDLEEEQPSTSYTSHGGHSSHISRKSTQATSRRSSSPSTPSDTAPTVAVNDLFRGIHQSVDEHDDQDDEEAEETSSEEKKGGKRFQRPEQPMEFQDACFGGIRFVDRAAVKPVSKVNKGYEFYMNFDDEELGLGMGRAQQLKVKFFKNTGTEKGKSQKMLEKKAAEKAKRQQEKEYAEKAAEAKELQAKQKEDEEAKDAEALKEDHEPQVVKTWQELVKMDLINLADDNRKSRRERLADLEKALMKLPGISSRWRVEVSQPSGRASTHNVHATAVSRIPKRAQFARPPRRIWYTPLHLANKKYYRTNWKKIRFDVRQLMKGKKFWPKLWINFEESHPKKLFELIQAKLAVKDFDKHGFKRVYDWGRGIHPDYIDWILEDLVPHPGKYYYPREGDSQSQTGAHDEVVRRASVEETDFRLKEWFVKPPRYIPDTPLSPPFDQADFCGYGDREKSFFLMFTLPREILHYYAPPSDIQNFFRNIPKPPYAFPGYTFKRWVNYPLDQKLPQYYPFPKRFMVWTRGKVGESLPCNSTVFYNDDPNIQKRDVEYSPYHDPHTRGYILRREILDRIWELGIINSKGEVKCSMKQFNKNRQILRDYEWLEEATKRWDLKWHDRQQQIRLTKDTNYDDYDWETKKKGSLIRRQRGKKFIRIRDTEDKKKFRMIMEKTARLMEEVESRRKRKRKEMIERARERQREQIKRQKMVMRAGALRVLQLQAIQEQKERNAQRQRRRRHLEQLEEQMQRKRCAWVRHAEFNRRKIEHVRMMEIELENEMKMMAQIHKRKVRREWADIPYAIIRKRERENWSKYCALKYGRIWLQKVRDRKKYLPDEDHMSVWTHGRHLDVTVKQLKKETGRKDVGTVFLETFKSAMAAQRALEEKQSKNEVKDKESQQRLWVKSKENEDERDGNLLDEDDEDDDDDDQEEDDEAGNLADEENSEEEKGTKEEESSRDGTTTDGGYEADEDEEGGE